jgi:uncharacterized protein YceK
MIGRRFTRLPYGGVRLDADLGAEAATMAFNGEVENFALLPVSAFIFLVDLPLSVVGDTLTLPFVLLKGPSERPTLEWLDTAPSTPTATQLAPSAEVPGLNSSSSK